MKYVKEMVIIFGITLAGEVLNQLIPLPVPAGLAPPLPDLPGKGTLATIGVAGLPRR